MIDRLAVYIKAKNPTQTSINRRSIGAMPSSSSSSIPDLIHDACVDYFSTKGRSKGGRDDDDNNEARRVFLAHLPSDDMYLAGYENVTFKDDDCESAEEEADDTEDDGALCIDLSKTRLLSRGTSALSHHQSLDDASSSSSSTESVCHQEALVFIETPGKTGRDDVTGLVTAFPKVAGHLEWHGIAGSFQADAEGFIDDLRDKFETEIELVAT